MYVFCGFCGDDKRLDKLAEHCKTIHNELPFALTSTKAPVKPIHSNWSMYMENYPKVKPEPIKDYLPYVSEQQGTKSSAENIKDSGGPQISRNDRKFKKHVRFQIEKGMQVNLFDLKHYNDLSTYETIGA